MRKKIQRWLPKETPNRYRLYIRGVQQGSTRTKRMSELKLKISGYKGRDWIIWYGTVERKMGQVIACGAYYTHHREAAVFAS